MKKFFRDEKGVSAVVSTVIIVAVTIAIAIAVALWMGGLASLFSPNLVFGQAIFEGNSNDSNNTIKIQVKNIGFPPLHLANVKVNGIDKTFEGITYLEHNAETELLIENAGWISEELYVISIGTTAADGWFVSEAYLAP